MNSEVTKFPDDAKLFSTDKSKEDCEDLQKDLTVLAERAMKWQID